MVKIILGGGGDRIQSFKTDVFFKEILQKERVGSILYVPLALRNNISFDKCLKWIKEVFPSLSSKFIMIESANDIKLKNLEEEIIAIYIGGGNTYNLLSEIRGSLLEKFMRKNINKTIFYGGSAGAIILAEDIGTCDDENEIKLSNLEGLRIIRKFSIWPHYEESQNPQIKKYVQNKKINVIAIPEESSMYVQDEKARAVGERDIYIFEVSGKKIKLNPNQEMLLQDFT